MRLWSHFGVECDLSRTLTPPVVGDGNKAQPLRACVCVRVFVGHAAQPLWYMYVCVLLKRAVRVLVVAADDSAVEGTTKALV